MQKTISTMSSNTEVPKKVHQDSLLDYMQREACEAIARVVSATAERHLVEMRLISDLAFIKRAGESIGTLDSSTGNGGEL